MVSWMYNNTKDVKTAIDNTLRVSAPLRPCVKLKNNNAKTQRRDGAKNKNLWANFRLCQKYNCVKRIGQSILLCRVVELAEVGF